MKYFFALGLSSILNFLSFRLLCLFCSWLGDNIQIFLCFCKLSEFMGSLLLITGQIDKSPVAPSWPSLPVKQVLCYQGIGINNVVTSSFAEHFYWSAAWPSVKSSLVGHEVTAHFAEVESRGEAVWHCFAGPGSCRVSARGCCCPWGTGSCWETPVQSESC